MRILGIDPGVATVGFGVIDSEGGRQRMVRYGAITTLAGMPLAAGWCRSEAIWAADPAIPAG